MALHTYDLTCLKPTGGYKDRPITIRPRVLTSSKKRAAEFAQELYGPMIIKKIIKEKV